MTEYSKEMMQVFETWYKGTIEKELESLDAIKARQSLFSKNREKLKESMKRSLENHAFNLEQVSLSEAYMTDEHRHTFDVTMSEIDKKAEEAKTAFEKALETLKKNHAEKLELSKLKTQKVKADYDYTVKKATETLLKVQNQADESIDKAIQRHSHNLSDLERDTNIRYHINDNRKEHRRLEFNKAYEAIKARFKNELQEANKTLEEKQKAYKEALKKRMAEHKKTMQPLDKTIESTKEKQEKALETLKDKQKEELTKQQSYLKEAKKLNDTTQMNTLEKSIKKLKKSHQEALDKTHEHQKEALQPKLDEKDKVLSEEKDAIHALKIDQINRIEEALANIERIKAEEKTAVDEQNTAYNKATLEYEQDRQAIRIDHDMQMSNFDHARDEVEQIQTHEKNRAQPESDLKENEAGALKAKEEAKIKRNDDVSTALYDREKEKKTIERNLDIKAFERQRNEAKHLRDHAIRNTKIQSRLKTFEKDYDHEAMLIDHYLKDSENYAALKSDLLKARKPAITQELQARSRRMIDMVETMIDDAKKDHMTMVDSIEKTYEEEVKIYKDTYEKMQKEHHKILENLSTEQALRRNKALEEIGKLTGKKNKKKKAQLTQNLNQQKQNDEETYTAKKRSLEKKEAIYKSMLSTIKEKRDRSLEEAQTLLYHMTDQFNAYLGTLKKLSKEESQAYGELAYSIKHRAHLFKNFQSDRKLETMRAAKEYLNTRVHRAKSEKTDNDARKDNYLKSLKEDFEDAKKHAANETDAAVRKYEQTVETLDKRLEETLAKITQDTRAEKKRLDLYITKLNRTHEARMQELKKRYDHEKENLFDEKDQSEKRLEAEKERLTNAFEQDKERYQAALQKTINFHASMIEKISAYLRADPLNRVTPEDAHTVVEILRGNDTLDSLK